MVAFVSLQELIAVTETTNSLLGNPQEVVEKI